MYTPFATFLTWDGTRGVTSAVKPLVLQFNSTHTSLTSTFDLEHQSGVYMKAVKF